MKFTCVLLIALFSAVAAHTSFTYNTGRDTRAAPSGCSLICSSSFSIPQEWSTAKFLLGIGCMKLGEAQEACASLLEVTDLTESWPNMVPYLTELKNYGCDAFCN